MAQQQPKINIIQVWQKWINVRKEMVYSKIKTKNQNTATFGQKCIIRYQDKINLRNGMK